MRLSAASRASAKFVATPESAYTGLTIASIGANSHLYAANFAQARDVFGRAGAPPLLGNFTDPNLPAGFAPFGIETIGSQSSSLTPRSTR